MGRAIRCTMLLLLVCGWTRPILAQRVKWEPHVGEAFDGAPLHGQLGHICVPAFHDRDHPGQVELVFVVYRTGHPRPAPPIFFLAGGPGGSGVELSGKVATHPQIRLLDHADVIGIDQRGTGLSRPNLMEIVGEASLGFEKAVTRADVVEAFSRAADEALDRVRDRGIDPAAFNTLQSALDLEAVRQSLKAEKVILYGASYGSHLGLSYLRRFPERVARAALIRIEGPDHTWKLPSVVQRQLESLAAAAERSPVARLQSPDLIADVRNLLGRLEATPLFATVISGPHAGRTLRLGKLDAAYFFAQSLMEPETAARIPQVIAALKRGNGQALLTTALELRRLQISALTLIMDCSSGGTAQRLARIEAERRDAGHLLGDALSLPFTEAACGACQACDVGDEDRQGFHCDVPTLFVSGTLDVRTPPENAVEVAAGFENHALIVVENAGHQSRELMSPIYRRTFQAFLRGEPVESFRIELPGIMFPR